MARIRYDVGQIALAELLLEQAQLAETRASSPARAASSRSVAESEGDAFMRHTIHVLRTAVVAGLLLGWSPAAAWAQAQTQVQSETFTATASLKTRRALR